MGRRELNAITGTILRVVPIRKVMSHFTIVHPVVNLKRDVDQKAHRTVKALLK